MQFLHSKEYSKKVKTLFTYKADLNIAVAFLGIDSCVLFENSPSKNIKLICNLESGACNPHAIEKIYGLENVTVKTNARLHAKTLISEKTTIVGSANISANGLSLEGKESDGWIETGTISDDKSFNDQSKKWFQNQWKSSRKVSTQDLELAKILWNKKRNKRTLPNRGSSLIESVFSRPEEFMNRDIYFAIYRDRKLSEEATNTYNTTKEVYSSLEEQLDIYENWSDLPADAYLISVYCGPRGGVVVDGIYKTPEDSLIEHFKYSDGSEGSITYCFKKKTIESYKLTAEDKELISNNIEAIISAEATQDDAFLVPLVNGVRAIKAFNKKIQVTPTAHLI